MTGEIYENLIVRATEEPSFGITKMLVDLYNSIVSMVAWRPKFKWKAIVRTVECSGSYF